MTVKSDKFLLYFSPPEGLLVELIDFKKGGTSNYLS